MQQDSHLQLLPVGSLDLTSSTQVLYVSSRRTPAKKKQLSCHSQHDAAMAAEDLDMPTRYTHASHDLLPDVKGSGNRSPLAMCTS